MVSKRKTLFSLVSLILLLVGVNLIIIIVYSFSQDDSISRVENTSEYKTQGEFLPSTFTSTQIAKANAETFLKKKSEDLPEKYSFDLVRVSEDAFGYVLATARLNLEDSDGETGTGGMIAIGQKKGDSYQFVLQGQSGFESQLDKLPIKLLDPNIRSYFRSDDKHRSIVGNIFPGIAFGQKYSELLLNLPWPKGEGFQITTLPGDNYHKGTLQNAIDFDMPVGTTLLPVSIAKVSDFKDDSDVGGCDPALASQANFIRLEINSSTTVLYLHTQKGSITEAGIKKGDTVIPGQPIAKSGQSGFTCNFSGDGPGPHLHLIMEKWCGDGENKYICGSLPMTFSEIDGEMQYGVSYLSANTTPTEIILDQNRKKAELEQVKNIINYFHEVFRCSSLRQCDQSTLLRYSVTEGMWQQLFESSCLFGCPPKWNTNQLISNQFTEFEIPDTGGLHVFSKQVWQSQTNEGRVVRHGKITHYSYVDHFLIKEGGSWKVDGYQIVCGYTLNQDGEVISEEEVIEDYNLESCPWQPENGSTP